ncbi:MAG: hypothetical protein JWR75_822 [Devosia sp.]|nr:hypothetical protein [Devosia sp.]
MPDTGPDADHAIVAHYSSSAITARILGALAERGDIAAGVTAEQLYPYDQLHGRELAATRDHVARLAPGPVSHVLDIGSGVGGPARYIAATTGARVTGIDLTPHFVVAATELTALVGLADTVDFVLGNAATLPFEDAKFDAAICFYVGMNLADKPAVLREIRRVLRPGGRLLWTEVVAGTGAPKFPLPWAVDPERSHVGSEEDLRDGFMAAGFNCLDVVDETAAHLEVAARAQAAGAAPPPALVAVNEVVLGADFSERRRNYIASLISGSLRSVAILAEAR